MKSLMCIGLFCSIIVSAGKATSDVPSSQRSREAIASVRPQLEDALTQEGLTFGSPIFIRIFKESRELEVWIESGDRFRLFRTYPICTFSGDLGPKERQGDNQAPEGFYYVTPARMNPLSQFHLSFDLGYPNAYDRAYRRTGSALMVHGDCVSIGCFAMTDDGIEEIYALADAALRSGQRFFRVHIFPFRMTEESMRDHGGSEWLSFWENLREGYDFFEEAHRPPNVLVRGNRYVFEDDRTPPLVGRAMDAASAGPGPVERGHSWNQLAPGLDLGFFKGPWVTPVSDTTITILRIDPGSWELRFLCASQTEGRRGMSAKEWCKKHGAVAAINAGMFMTDHETHVGYMRSGGHVNSSGVNHYQSALCFSPKTPTEPPARIFDLDETPLGEILGRYNDVAQNLRLIKHPGTNRWSQQKKKWSEAAVGEDAGGRILFIFSRSPFTMHDFNEILLGLPIDLVCAQHMEGGPEAQIYIHYGDTEYQRVGSYETGFWENDFNMRAWPIPNALCVMPRDP
jgi:murein L,D-transpeptidase YafK